MATKATTEERIGADRSRFRPPVAEESSASARSRQKLIEDVGTSLVEMDRMREQARFQKDLEAVRGAATAAGTAFDIEAGIQDGDTEDVFSNLREEDPAAYEELTQFYDDADELRQAFKAGRLSGSQFEQRLDTLYRQASARRPGYRDRLRQQARNFLGFDPGQNVNRRIFGFGPEELEELQGDDPLGTEDRLRNSLDWLLQNRSTSTETSQQLRQLARSNPDFIIDMASRERTSVNQTAEVKKELELLQDQKGAFNARLETAVVDNFAEKMDTALLSSWVGAREQMNQDGVRFDPSNPEAFLGWYQENSPAAIAQYEQVAQNPEQTAMNLIRNNLPEGTPITQVSPETVDSVTERVRQRAQDNLQMLRDPAYVGFLMSMSEGRIAGEQMQLLDRDAYRRYRAVFGEDPQGVLSTVLAVEGARKSIKEDLLPYFRGELGFQGEGAPPSFSEEDQTNNARVWNYYFGDTDLENPFEGEKQRIDQSPNVTDKDKAKAKVDKNQLTGGVDIILKAPEPKTDDAKQTQGEAMDKAILPAVESITGGGE